MNGKDLLRIAINFVTSASVGAVVKNIVQHTTPYTATTLDRIASGVGSVIITAVVSDHCSKYVEDQILGEEKK